MQLRKPLPVVLVLLLNAGVHGQSGAAQFPSDRTSYQVKRQQAAALFQQGKRLEALPLLEDLVQSNSKDDEMLVELAASLVEHAATLTDQDAAAGERFRARDLLDQAWKLGNTSVLGENLAHLLKELPPSGAIKFSADSAVDRIMRAGEAAFARRDFDEAIKNYASALELEPKNYSAALFIGNSYDRKNDFSGARQWYQRAMAIDPNTETAYRYCADMLAKQGDMAGARTMLIHAAVAEPYNRMVWRELNAWATINKTAINMIYIGPPAPKGQLERSSKTHERSTKPDATQPLPDFGPVWNAYWVVRTGWQKGDAFQKHHPQETKYRHSLGEESEALTAAAQMEERDRKAAKNATPLALSNDLSMDLLLKLYQAGLIEAYVLFSLGDQGIAHDYAPYRAKNRAKLEEYMDRFVVPNLQ